MMKTLINSNTVINEAFGEGEYISPSTILDADIAAAESRYLLPVVGRPLYEALLDGEHPELVADYVAPALAMAVRTSIQRALNVRTGQCGLSAPNGVRADTSLRSAANALQISLVERRRALLQRLSDYLAANRNLYPLYDPKRDILQTCSVYGGIVQIH